MLVKFWHWLTEEYHCDNCELLKNLLDQERRNNRLILEALLEQNKPKVVMEQIRKEEEIKPIRTGHIPWAVKQQMLEAESRAEARILQEKLRNESSGGYTNPDNGYINPSNQNEVDKLEKELGVQ